MRRRTPEERYQYSIRKQQQALEEFAAHEIEWADHLIHWYSMKKQDMPDDEYRAAAYFINKEFTRKSGSLTELYLLFGRLMNELPSPTKELAFDLLAYRFKKYGQTLIRKGY